jgi:hypothetical protein
MAGFVEVAACQDTTMNEPELHALDALACGADVAAGAAKIPAFRGQAIISGECDDARAEEFGLFAGVVVGGEHAPPDRCIANVERENNRHGNYVSAVIVNVRSDASSKSINDMKFSIDDPK